MMQYFATPLRPSQQTTHSLRASQYRPSRKRKRDDDSEEPPPLAPPVASPRSDSASGLTPPPEPFPHHPAKHVRNTVTNAKLHESIAALNPPVFAANALSRAQPVRGHSQRSTLRGSHLDILTTTMHCCLLAGDYDRADRAWARILRTHAAGNPLDPRYHGRWGVGAELLLRRRATTHVSHQDTESKTQQNQTQPGDPAHIYTRHGLELAQDYYERLIIQYPFRKTSPNAVDARAFYPPLFTTWIRAILDRSRRDRSQYQEHLRRRSSSAASDDAEDDTIVLSLEEIRTQELSHAQELCERLDQVIISPPFDKHTELLFLRGNVGLWISDLIVGRTPIAAGQDQQAAWDDMSMTDHSDVNAASESTDNQRKYRQSLHQLHLARDFFTRAETHGAGSLDAAKAGIDVRIKSLGKQMSTFD
ncbi:unnamed protein product [Periconia digitata]|uniref:Uncharacterized protein n=1 Tax=Periconia digitata TaxID=1303443 RepID=A0A9W4UMU3_9PLEO|nr:unnamed protein product [Periconia digitata]